MPVSPSLLRQRLVSVSGSTGVPIPASQAAVSGPVITMLVPLTETTALFGDLGPWMAADTLRDPHPWTQRLYPTWGLLFLGGSLLLLCSQASLSSYPPTLMVPACL